MKRVMFLLALMLGLLLDNKVQGQLHTLKGAEIIPTAEDTVLLFPGVEDAYISGKNFSPEEAISRLKTGEKMYAEAEARNLAFANTIRHYHLLVAERKGFEFKTQTALDDYIEETYGFRPDGALELWLKDSKKNFSVKIPNPDEEFLSGGTLIVEGKHQPRYKSRTPYKKGDTLPKGVQALEDERHLGIKGSTLFPGESIVDQGYVFSFFSLVCVNSAIQKTIPLWESPAEPTANIEKKKAGEDYPPRTEMVGFRTEYVYSHIVSVQYVPVYQPVFYCGTIWLNTCNQGCWNSSPAPMNWCYPTCCGGGGDGGSTTNITNNNTTNIVNNVYNYGDDEPDPDDEEDPDPIDDGGVDVGPNGNGGPILAENDQNNNGGAQSDFEYQNLLEEGEWESVADVLANPVADSKEPVVESKPYDVFNEVGYQPEKPESKPETVSEYGIFNEMTYEPQTKPTSTSNPVSKPGAGEGYDLFDESEYQANNQKPASNDSWANSGVDLASIETGKPQTKPTSTSNPVSKPGAGNDYDLFDELVYEENKKPLANTLQKPGGGNNFQNLNNPNTSLVNGYGDVTRNPYNQVSDYERPNTGGVSLAHHNDGGQNRKPSFGQSHNNGQGGADYSKPSIKPDTNVSLHGGYKPSNTQSHNNGGGGGGGQTFSNPNISAPSMTLSRGNGGGGGGVSRRK